MGGNGDGCTAGGRVCDDVVDLCSEFLVLLDDQQDIGVENIVVSLERGDFGLESDVLSLESLNLVGGKFGGGDCDIGLAPKFSDSLLREFVLGA